jgi:hypothetical protein
MFTGIMGDGMGLTLRQAAEQSGASRSTIHRALKSGKLSGTRTEAGDWSIDPAELARAFPRDSMGHDHRDDKEQERAGAGPSAEVLAVRVEMLQQQLDRERDTIEDLRRRLDRSEERVLALTMEGRATAKDRPSWWSRLTGR